MSFWCDMWLMWLWYYASPKSPKNKNKRKWKNEKKKKIVRVHCLELWYIAYKLKPRLFHKSTHLWDHLMDFHPWQYYQTTKSTVASKQFCLLNPLLQFCLQSNLCTSKSKIASSYHNSSTSTLVPPLRTPFNIILCFSDYLAYLPNTLWYSRQIYQRDHSSLRSPSSTIHPGQTALLVPDPSIILADNNPN